MPTSLRSVVLPVKAYEVPLVEYPGLLAPWTAVVLPTAADLTNTFLVHFPTSVTTHAAPTLLPDLCRRLVPCTFPGAFPGGGPQTLLPLPRWSS